MNKKLNYDTLKKMCEICAPPGHEESVAEEIRARIPDGVELFSDAMGNITIHKKGTGPKVMLMAHMDECGIVVTYIEKNGLLRFAPLGKLEVAQILYKSVRMSDGIYGVISPRGGKELKDMTVDSCCLDIGANDEKEAAACVRIGDVGTFDTKFVVLGNGKELEGRFYGKGMSSRAGCFIMLELLDNLGEISFDMYFCFAVQGEVGQRGAPVSAYNVQPEIVISVGTSAVKTEEDANGSVKLGGGAVLKLMDGSMIGHKALVDWIAGNAERQKIPYQLEIQRDNRSNAGAAHISGFGAMSGGVSVPCRNMHNGSGIVDIKDIENAFMLLNECLKTEFERRNEGEGYTQAYSHR